jgi:photosystem II stability/assembly factor-like uncharacterized protein
MKRLPLCVVLFVLGSSSSAQIRDTFDQLRPAEIPWGGYTGAVAIHPTRPNELFAGAGPGGLYRTVDGGAHWRPVISFPSWNVGYVSYCPSDPRIVIATTWLSDTRIAHRGGIWRSDDGGARWKQAPAPPETDRCPDRAGAAGVSWYGRTVWVATDCGLRRSDDLGETWRPLIIVDPAAAGETPDRMLTVLALDANHVVAGGQNGYYYMQDGRTWHRSEGAQPNLGCAHGLAASPANSRLLFRADYQTAYLQYSPDQGITWRNFPQSDLEAGNMPAFVYAVPRARSRTNFELYFGTGSVLKRAVIPYDIRRWSTVRFETLALDHLDPGDIAFHPTTRRPVLLVGDFGIMNTDDDGRTWHMVGAGPGGHNALNVYALGVQNVRSRSQRSDISFITWHNDTWISRDSGATWAMHEPTEGGVIRASGPDLNDESEVFIALSPGNGSQKLFTGGLAGEVTVPTPRDGNCWRNYMFFRNPADGRQNILAVAYDCEGSRAIYDRRATEETTWREVARLDPGGGFIGLPQAAVRDGNVTLYQAFTNAQGRIVLVRTENANAAGVISRPSMGHFRTMTRTAFNGGEPVWAVKPDDERVLIAADATSGSMERSTTGGDEWEPMPELTSLVTDGGALRFETDGQSQVTVVAFNPFDPSDVVVGTMAAGLFRSSDGGETWHPALGSERIRNITAVAFDRDRTTYVTGDGYGIWRWRERLDRLPFDVLRIFEERLLVRDPASGELMPIDIIFNPDRCPACTLVLARSGAIRSLRNDPKGGLIVGATEPQMLVTVGGVRSIAPVLTLPENGFAELCPVCNDAKDLIVRGLLIGDGKVHAVLAGKDEEWSLSDEFLFGGKGMPQLELDGVQHGPGFDVAETGETISIRGDDFNANDVVAIILNGQCVETAKTDVKGSFAVRITLQVIPGQSYIAAVQKGSKLVRRELFIGNRDE